MSKATTDPTAALRERVARSQVRPGYHPYFVGSPVVADEPLWAISCRPRATADWVGPYRTATRDLDQAIAEARTHLRVPKRAAVSVLPTVPSSDSYGKAKDILTSMMLAVPSGHAAAGEMLDQLQAALRTVDEARADGRYFGGLTVSLPITLEVDELRNGRPRSLRRVSWMDHGGDWPEWHRCT